MDRCGCGSGNIFAACCGPSLALPAPMPTELPGLTTGLSVSGCYAAPLRDCRGRLSAEHPVSEAILRFLAREGGNVAVSNHPWQRIKGVRQLVPARRLKARVLCERHNVALSGLDTGMQKFVQAVALGMATVAAGGGRKSVALFNGYDIERWMLKAVCGLQVGRRVAGDIDPRPWKPPRSWLKALFEAKPLPRGAGLYAIRRQGSNRVEASIYIRVLSARFRSVPRPSKTRSTTPLPPQDSVIGLWVSTFGYEIMLLMVEPRLGALDSRMTLTYRPWETKWTAPDSSESRLYLVWDGHPRSTRLDFTLAPADSTQATAWLHTIEAKLGL